MRRHVQCCFEAGGALRRDGPHRAGSRGKGHSCVAAQTCGRGHWRTEREDADEGRSEVAPPAASGCDAAGCSVDTRTRSASRRLLSGQSSSPAGISLAYEPRLRRMERDSAALKAKSSLRRRTIFGRWRRGLSHPWKGASRAQTVAQPGGRRTRTPTTLHFSSSVTRRCCRGPVAWPYARVAIERY